MWGLTILTWCEPGTFFTRKVPPAQNTLCSKEVVLPQCKEGSQMGAIINRCKEGIKAGVGGNCLPLPVKFKSTN